jgi:hypothetical protein
MIVVGVLARDLSGTHALNVRICTDTAAYDPAGIIPATPVRWTPAKTPAQLEAAFAQRGIRVHIREIRPSSGCMVK